MKKNQTFLFTTKTIAYTSLFTAISIVMNIITVPFSINGTAISFTYVPCVLAGAFLGPLPGFLCGLIGDGLGVIISPKGAWSPLITLGTSMIGLIPGIIFRIKKIHPKLLLALSFLLVFLVTTVTLNTLGLFLLYAQGKKTFFAYLLGRLPMQIPILSINIYLTYVLYALLKPSFSLEKENKISAPQNSHSEKILKEKNVNQKITN